MYIFSNQRLKVANQNPDRKLKNFFVSGSGVTGRETSTTTISCPVHEVDQQVEWHPGMAKPTKMFYINSHLFKNSFLSSAGFSFILLLDMELVSKRRLTQQSNMYLRNVAKHVLHKFRYVLYTIAYHFGRYKQSSPSTKEFLGLDMG